MNRFDVLMICNNVAWFTAGGTLCDHNYPAAALGCVVSFFITIMVFKEANK